MQKHSKGTFMSINYKSHVFLMLCMSMKSYTCTKYKKKSYLVQSQCRHAKDQYIQLNTIESSINVK